MTENNVEPSVAAFLALLEADLVARPAEAVLAFPRGLAERLEELTAEVEFDPDAPIEGRVSL